MHENKLAMYIQYLTPPPQKPKEKSQARFLNILKAVLLFLRR